MRVVGTVENCILEEVNLKGTPVKVCVQPDETDGAISTTVTTTKSSAAEMFLSTTILFFFILLRQWIKINGLLNWYWSF